MPSSLWRLSSTIILALLLLSCNPQGCRCEQLVDSCAADDSRIMSSSTEQPITLPNSNANGLVSDLKSNVAVIITHPWGPLGGNMHNNVVVAAYLFFKKLGITTLRFDFNGWQIGRGTAQVEQVKEAATLLLTNPQVPEEERPKHILLVGYSYGSLITASASADIPECIGAVSIAPPFAVKHWLLLFNSGYHIGQAKKRETLPRLYLIGDQDNFTSEKVFKASIETFPQPSTTGAVLRDADHFFHRREKDVMNIISEWLLKTFPQCDNNLRKLASVDFSTCAS